MPAEDTIVAPDERHRVLLIEDQAELRDIYAQFLGVWGYASTTAGSCAEARAAFKPGEFACALVDLGLPDGNGMDLLAEFSSRDPLLVSVVLTGDQRIDSVIETMRKGAFDYLTKPLSMDALRPALMRAFAHHEVVRQRAALTQLLLEERRQLKRKVEETTKDLRLYAASCETSNARLNALLRLVQSGSSGLQTDEDRFRGVLTEVRRFVPIAGIVLRDATLSAFLSAYYAKDGEIVIVAAEERSSEEPFGEVTSPDALRILLEDCLARHTKLALAELDMFVFPQILANRRACTVGVLVESRGTVDETEREFLGMCAHHLAAEWEMTHLLQHAARYASIGSIALELSKTFVQSLTAIQVSADVLGEMVESEEIADGLSIIPVHVAHIRDLIRDFRELSRGKDTIETVCLDRIVEQALVVLSVAIRKNNVRIIRQFETDGKCVLLNSTALARTVLDLIANAVRSAANGGTISLQLHNAAGGTHVHLEIVLDGAHAPVSPGVARAGEGPPSIFSKDHPGLLLAQRTVHSCAGKLAVEFDDNGSAMLRIVLPRDATRARLTAT